MEFRRSSDSSNAENLQTVIQLLYKHKIQKEKKLREIISRHIYFEKVVPKEEKQKVSDNQTLQEIDIGEDVGEGMLRDRSGKLSKQEWKG